MIEVTDVHKTFFVPHKVTALVGVSTKIEAGEVVVVIGPSGSGKSTMLRCCNRLEEPTDGAVHVDGVDLLSPRTDVNAMRRRIGMVFQAFNLYPHLDALGNVTLALRRVRRKKPTRSQAKAARPRGPRRRAMSRSRLWGWAVLISLVSARLGSM